MARSGRSGCAKKNQCHHAVAKRASARASASPIGTLSSTASRRHGVGRVQREPDRDVAAAVVSDDGEPLATQVPHQRVRTSRAIARLLYGAWSAVVGGLLEPP